MRGEQNTLYKLYKYILLDLTETNMPSKDHYLHCCRRRRPKGPTCLRHKATAHQKIHLEGPCLPLSTFRPVLTGILWPRVSSPKKKGLTVSQLLFLEKTIKRCLFFFKQPTNMINTGIVNMSFCKSTSQHTQHAVVC